MQSKLVNLIFKKISMKLRLIFHKVEKLARQQHCSFYSFEIIIMITFIECNTATFVKYSHLIINLYRPPRYKYALFEIIHCFYINCKINSSKENFYI